MGARAAHHCHTRNSGLHPMVPHRRTKPVALAEASGYLRSLFAGRLSAGLCSGQSRRHSGVKVPPFGMNRIHSYSPLN
jgi:hypothetical protein